MTTNRLFATQTEKRAWLALLLLAAILRIAALGSRPFHHDESIHAWASNRLAFEGEYVYDPVYHGPVQYFLVAAALRIEGLFASPKAMVPGEGDLAARLPAALGGVALVALALLLRPRFGAAVAFVSGALLAVSPNFLYYTRFCREDVWSLLGTAGGFLFLDSWVRESRPRDLVFSSLLFSVAFASKENFYVLCALMVPSVLAAWAEPGRGFDVWNRLRRLIDFFEKNAVAVAAAILLFFNVSLVLYTVFLTHPESGNPALTAISYWWGQHKVERVGGPKWYYLPRLLQYEFAILVPALLFVFARWRRLSAVERFLAGWGISSLVMYAWLGEKTPWLLLHQILPLVPLAARGWVSAWERGPRGQAVGALAAAVTVWFSLGLSFVRPAITPAVMKAESVVYVQTAPEVIDLRDRILAYGRIGEIPAAIIAGEAGWPMSWYVRRAPVNWEMPRGDLKPPIVVCDVNQAPKAAAALGPGYVRDPDVPLRAWWIPEASLSPLVPSPGDLLRYLVTREVWRGKLPPGVNPIGALYVAVFRRTGPALLPAGEPPAVPPPGGGQPKASP